MLTRLDAEPGRKKLIVSSRSLKVRGRVASLPVAVSQTTATPSRDVEIIRSPSWSKSIQLMLS